MDCAASVNHKISKDTSYSINQRRSKDTSVSINRRKTKDTIAVINQKSSKKISASFIQRSLNDIRCYGYFHCWRCNNSWQSEHVFCHSGVLCHSETQQVKYRQKCKRCQTFYKPFRTEAINCVQCHSREGRCQCAEPDYPEPTLTHRRDLCERCLSSSGWCDQGEDGASDEDVYDNEYDDNVNDGTSGYDMDDMDEDGFDNGTEDDGLCDED